MNKDDIKKALECCSNPSINPCKDCPYNKNDDFSYCNDKILKDTLNLITEQEKDIKQLKTECALLDDELRIARQETINVLNELKRQAEHCDQWNCEVIPKEYIDEMIKELVK